MALQLNHNDPKIMHIDLNSCFATVAQQAYPHLRNKPLVIAAYDTPNGCVVAPSIEAKRYGIKTGMTVRDAKLKCKGVIVRMPEPLLIRDVHTKFNKVCRDYSPLVFPKSIDELVIDFDGTPALERGLVNIGQEIKDRIRREVGEWISCNVGIGTNRFLAKLAASLNKPDGMDIITHQNLRKIYNQVKLTDLDGISIGYEARLNANGIFTPIQFLDADEDYLHKQVFKSVVGKYWYMDLRGWEVRDVEFARKSFGQDYALGKKTADPEELARLLMKLTEKMGRRMRKWGKAAYGIHVAVIYVDYSFWHRGKKFRTSVCTTNELFKRVMQVFNMQPERKIVGKLSVSGYDLESNKKAQEELFETTENKLRRVSDAVDEINDRYGEQVITPGMMMNMKNLVLDRVAFGSIKEIEDVYFN